MAIPTTWADISQTAGTNPPDGAVETVSDLDGHARQTYAFLAELNDDKAPLTIPSVATGATTAATTHRGKCLAATGDITVPDATFAAGDVFSVYNNSASSISLVQASGLTLRLAGTTTTGSRTLAPRGMATVWFVGASEAIASGAGVA